jgi:hypothetical protein
MGLALGAGADNTRVHIFTPGQAVRKGDYTCTHITRQSKIRTCIQAAGHVSSTTATFTCNVRVGTYQIAPRGDIAYM